MWLASKALIRIICFALAISLVAGAAVAWGQREVSELDFPLFGIARGQTFLFSVGCVPDPTRPEERDLRCRGTLEFRDSRNRPLGTPAPVDLGPYETASHELDAGTLRLRPRERVDFRPVITEPAGTGRLQASFNVLSSHVGELLAHASAPPDEPFQTSGLSACPILTEPAYFTSLAVSTGESVQLSVVRTTQPSGSIDNAPLPCDVTLQIERTAGQVLVSQPTGPLQPGESATVSVNGATLTPQGGGFPPFLDLVVFATGTTFIEYPSAGECLATTNVGCKLSVQKISNANAWTQLISISQ
jgi:hypothetical protein